jgi:hypothetical protein
MKPLYLKTNDMAKLIGYSRDYLLKNREIIFFEGIHYFSKDKRLNWKVEKMIEWVEGNSLSDKAKNILNLVS